MKTSRSTYAAWFVGVLTVLGAATSEAVEPCDVEAGAEIYSAKCALCHSVALNQNGTVGPSLYGVVGRPPGGAPGFNYTAALTKLAGIWSRERLDWFLQDPSGRVPGTLMAFSGLHKDEARSAVICYLASLRAVGSPSAK
jgi:cytochrome c